MFVLQECCGECLFLQHICSKLNHTATHSATHCNTLSCWCFRIAGMLKRRFLPSTHLQHTVPHCNTLQHIERIVCSYCRNAAPNGDRVSFCNTPATHCTTLQHTATHRERLVCFLNTGMLQRMSIPSLPATHLKHTVQHCNTLQHAARDSCVFSSQKCNSRCRPRLFLQYNCNCNCNCNTLCHAATRCEACVFILYECCSGCRLHLCLQHTCNTLYRTTEYCNTLRETCVFLSQKCCSGCRSHFCLQHTCNTLYHTATHLQHTVPHCNTPATHCTTLQHTCNTLCHVAIHYNTLRDVRFFTTGMF